MVPGSLGRGKTDGTSLRVQLVHSHPDETVMASRLGVSARRREGSWCRSSVWGVRGERQGGNRARHDKEQTSGEWRAELTAEEHVSGEYGTEIYLPSSSPLCQRMRTTRT